MLSKNTITFLRSLQKKEGREESRSFLVEGEKNITELLASSFTFVEGYLSPSFIEKYESIFVGKKITPCSLTEIERITTLKTNTTGVVVFEMRDDTLAGTTGITLVLDDINDPGNLGTIIRIADWYGVVNIIASEHTVDCYNPKVIMASMGSFGRVNVHYTNLSKYLSKVSEPIYGAYLEGENIHALKNLPKNLHLVIGSESHGISQELEKYITHKITIPRFGEAESLNAGVATAVILDKMKN